MARVRIKGNFQKFIDQFEDMRQAFEGKQGIRVRIINEVEYFIKVEYGTSKFEARAMVRRSIEPIMEIFNQYWHQLEWPITPEKLHEMMEVVKKDAIEEIKKRTPVKTGRLKGGFDGYVEEY